MYKIKIERVSILLNKFPTCVFGALKYKQFWEPHNAGLLNKWGVSAKQPKMHQSRIISTISYTKSKFKYVEYFL